MFPCRLRGMGAGMVPRTREGFDMTLPTLWSVIAKLTVAAAMVVLVACASTTFVPISWGMRDKVLSMSQRDEVLRILFQRYDPERKTLRVDGPSFELVDLPHSNWRFEGAYRAETHLIYRNLDISLEDPDLRNIMAHEMAHHIWSCFLNEEKKKEWGTYLAENPSHWQPVIRQAYRDVKVQSSEDFAYAVTFPRSADVRELATLDIISEEEMQRWLKVCPPPEVPATGGEPVPPGQISHSLF